MHTNIFRELRLLWNVERTPEQIGNSDSNEDSPQNVTDSSETLFQEESLETAVQGETDERVQNIEDKLTRAEVIQQKREERRRPLRENIEQTVADLRQKYLDFATLNASPVDGEGEEAIEERMEALWAQSQELHDHEDAISQVWDELDEPERQEFEQKIASAIPSALYHERPEDEYVDGVIHRFYARIEQGQLVLGYDLDVIMSEKSKQFAKQKEEEAFDSSRKLNNPEVQTQVDAASSRCKHIDLALLPGTKNECGDAGCYQTLAEKGDDIILHMPPFDSDELQDRAYAQFKDTMKNRGWGRSQGGVRFENTNPESMPEVLDHLLQFDSQLEKLMKLHAKAKAETSGLRGILIPNREEVEKVFERLQSDEQKELLKEGLKNCDFGYQMDLAILIEKLSPDICEQLLNDGPLSRKLVSEVADQFSKFTKVEKKLFLRFPIGRIAHEELNQDGNHKVAEGGYLIHPNHKTVISGTS